VRFGRYWYSHRGQSGPLLHNGSAAQTLLDRLEGLRRQKFILHGQDPDQISLGLECVDLIGVEQNVFRPAAPYDFANVPGSLSTGAG